MEKTPKYVFFQIQTRFIYFSEVRVVSAEETLKVIVNQIFYLFLVWMQAHGFKNFFFSLL